MYLGLEILAMCQDKPKQQAWMKIKHTYRKLTRRGRTLQSFDQIIASAHRRADRRKLERSGSGRDVMARVWIGCPIINNSGLENRVRDAYPSCDTCLEGLAKHIIALSGRSGSDLRQTNVSGASHRDGGR